MITDGTKQQNEIVILTEITLFERYMLHDVLNCYICHKGNVFVLNRRFYTS